MTPVSEEKVTESLLKLLLFVHHRETFCTIKFNKMNTIGSYVVATTAVAVPVYFLVSRWAQGGQFKKDDVRIDGKVVIITGANTGNYLFDLKFYRRDNRHLRPVKV